jgi:aminoglycoside phosphotransferase family enzyme/predicted kinase
LDHAAAVPLSEEAELIAWLTEQSDRVVETACARVFLTGEAAYKLKRRADLGYVDFSSPEVRAWALQRELEFNKLTAPDIYRRLRRITRTAQGGLAFDGEGETVELALEMRRFADDAVLAVNPDAVDGEMGEALGRTIAGLHATAELRPEGGWQALAWTISSNAGLLRELAPKLGAERVETLIDLTNAAFETHKPLLQARTAAGFSRRCHGDLHLANILVEDGRPILFDCIEFKDLLSDLDVLYDLAFLLMDLDFRDRRDAGVRVLSAYLDEAARSFPPTLWDGLAALPLMLSVRAGVRAHVQAHGGDLAGARAYVEAGVAHLSPAPPVLAAVGGLSGSGKSTVSRGIAPALGASPGAVVLRTDEIRKRLLNVAPTQPVDRALYTPEFYVRTYDALFDNARALLAAGRAVVLDATFLDPALRQRAERLAADCGVPFHGLWLDAPAKVLEARVAARTGDASDATVEVLHDQMAKLANTDLAWSRVDTRGDLAAAAEAWVAGRGVR